MPASARITVTGSRRYPLPADQLYIIVSDVRGHHQRIMPSTISTSSYRVVGGPDIDSTHLELTGFEGNTSRSYRLTMTETDPGRAFRFVDSGRDRWIEFRVRDIDDGESELTIVISECADRRLRFMLSQFLKRQAAHRTIDEVLENIDRYRQTLGSRVITSSDLLTARDTDERD